MIDFRIILQQFIQFAVIPFIGYLTARKNIVTKVFLPAISRLISKVLLPFYIFVNIVDNGSL